MGPRKCLHLSCGTIHSPPILLSAEESIFLRETTLPLLLTVRLVGRNQYARRWGMARFTPVPKAEFQPTESRSTVVDSSHGDWIIRRSPSFYFEAGSKV
jgi:hypothetical protein